MVPTERKKIHASHYNHATTTWPPCFAVGALRIGETYGMPTKPLVKTLFFTSVNLKHTTYTLKTSTFQDKIKDHFTIIQLCKRKWNTPFQCSGQYKAEHQPTPQCAR
jgi:hypothetical protein